MSIIYPTAFVRTVSQIRIKLILMLVHSQLPYQYMQ